jgi:hypothetical protein
MNAMNAGILAAIFFSLMCTTPPAAAIYKCEQAGVLTYTDIPCDGQQLSAPALERPRGTEERQDKQIRDLSARGAAARERKCKSLALQLKWREEDLREAPLHEQTKARKMARRAAEKYRNDCQ